METDENALNVFPCFDFLEPGVNFSNRWATEADLIRCDGIFLIVADEKFVKRDDGQVRIVIVHVGKSDQSGQ